MWFLCVTCRIWLSRRSSLHAFRTERIHVLLNKTRRIFSYTINKKTNSQPFTFHSWTDICINFPFSLTRNRITSSARLIQRRLFALCIPQHQRKINKFKISVITFKPFDKLDFVIFCNHHSLSLEGARYWLFQTIQEQNFLIDLLQFALTF